MTHHNTDKDRKRKVEMNGVMKNRCGERKELDGKFRCGGMEREVLNDDVDDG